MASLPAAPAPEAGQLVVVRRRPALVVSASPAPSKEGPRTLVHVEYLDGYAHPSSDKVVWEIEVGAAPLKNAGWPKVESTHREPMAPKAYDAYLDAVRWTSLQSIQDLLQTGQGLPLVSPWSAALQVEDYQLTPLLRAMAMPRVSLLLADDVGLGKTIQAGLVATELIVRRRIRRILIVCPASLQLQWVEGMKDKFHLDFTILDADEARRTQRELGADVNPWSVHSRIITSMDYLRQEVVYQRFESSARKRQGEGLAAFAPWDLLIVDEAHNATPKSLTDRSQRSQMLRRLTRWFEHRLFLTATPHNGYTESFTGLLELLDEVRFVQAPALSDSDRRQLDVVMVRRLKKEIDEVSSVRRFPEREVKAVPVSLARQESALFDALREYREAARKQLLKEGNREQVMGQFVFSLLTKRLLSSSYAFARTWWAHVAGQGGGTFAEAQHAVEEADADVADDEERESRERLALAETGSWLLKHTPALRGTAEHVSEALRKLGWTEEATAKGPDAGLQIPDGKCEALLAHIREGVKGAKLPALLGAPDRLHEDERLILFTEYRDTQAYLQVRLAQAGYDAPAVRLLFGGMARQERDDIKAAFNDETSRLRLLLATDAASEGLNLQMMCRYVAHYDIPWNPMRLEQRNGRVDRHGQARDVTVFHYASEDEADQRFLSFIARKVNEVRNDLGSVGTVLDEGVSDYFWARNTTQERLEEWVEQARRIDPAKSDLRELRKPTKEDFHGAKQRFEAASKAHGLRNEAIENLVRTYLEAQKARLEPHAQGLRVLGTRGGLDKALRRHLADKQDRMPFLVFDPRAFLVRKNNRELYRPIPGARLIRLGHPLTQMALAHYRRALWGQEADVNRWTLAGYKPEFGSDTYVELHHLVTVRNVLQEVVHTEVGTWWFLLGGRGLVALDAAPEVPAVHALSNDALMEQWEQLRKRGTDELIKDAAAPLREQIRAEGRKLWTQRLKEAERAVGTRLKDDLERRLAELKKDQGEARKKKLQAMLVEAELARKQWTFNPAENARRAKRVEELRARIEEDDLEVWDRNRKTLIERLQAEHERYVRETLPKRHQLAGVEVAEVGVRILVPDGGA
jgi:superfamily II DNA or RNA helicase/anti-sigma28 factor (negative regulator of flagellin synthesis)